MLLFLPAPFLGEHTTNCWRETSSILKIGSRVTEDPSAFTLVCWLPAPVTEHGLEHTGRAGGTMCRRPRGHSGPCSLGWPYEHHRQGEHLVGTWPTSCSGGAQLAAGSSLHRGSVFHAGCLTPGRYLRALTLSFSGFVPPF